MVEYYNECVLVFFRVKEGAMDSRESNIEFLKVMNRLLFAASLGTGRGSMSNIIEVIDEVLEDFTGIGKLSDSTSDMVEQYIAAYVR